MIKNWIMTQSRHFSQPRNTRSVKNNLKSGTFDSEIKKFDNELKKTINEDNKNNKSDYAKSTKGRKRVKHIKLESDADIDLFSGDDNNSNNNNDDNKIPDNFFPIYNKIKFMRSLITTPVDLIGCIEIPPLLQLITKEYKITNKIKHIEINDIISLKPQLKEIEELGVNKIWRFQLLTTLLFSSQTKDEVNFQVMQSLHHHYLNNGYEDGLCIQAILDTDEKQIDQMIYKIGFHSRKAIYLKETANILHNDYNDDIPTTIDELIQLKGIGYKMGHLILQGAWKEVIGISVDTHMVRLCNMFGWLSKKDEKNPDNVRKELEKMLINHKDLWSEINPVLVGFGQSVCTPTGRRCDLCLLSKINEKNDYLCPAVDKRLLLRIQRGVEKEDRKVRGDLEKLIKFINE
jgi:endonuclease-3